MKASSRLTFIGEANCSCGFHRAFEGKDQEELRIILEAALHMHCGYGHPAILTELERIAKQKAGARIKRLDA